MIKQFSLIALQKAINHALALDETTPAKIQLLHGKIIEVIIAPLGVNFFITFEHRQLRLLDHCTQQPDTIIHSNPLGLIRLSFLPASKARSLFNDKIRVSGNVELGQEVKQLFDELDIDWEGHLAHFTGDVVAYQFGSIIRRGLTFQRHMSQSLCQNITGFLQEEQRLFPSAEEAQDFFKDVDQISLDVERLDAQIKLLMASYEID